MNECICCRDRLLRHLSHRRMYWFCPTCHQEMPSIDEFKTYSQADRRLMGAIEKGRLTGANKVVA